MLLRDIEGWSYKQLAAALNIPSDTVMSRLGRARQRLRQELASAPIRSCKMECEEAERFIDVYLDGELDPDRWLALEQCPV